MTTGCPHVAAAHGYARDVVAGTVPACKWIVLTCRRHLDDLVKQYVDGFPYRFDERKASKVCKFVQLMPHTKGKWARKAERLKLEPWQLFKTAALFGWVRKSDEIGRAHV